MYPRYVFISPGAAEKLVDDFYNALSRLHARFFAVRFDNPTDSKNPLVIYPPKGVGVDNYREALLRRTDFESPEALAATDFSIKSEIREAFRKEAGGINQKTLGRTLVNAINSTSAYEIKAP